MAFCTNCGNELLPGQQFCPSCGTSLASNIAPKVPVTQSIPQQSAPAPQPNPQPAVQQPSTPQPNSSDDPWVKTGKNKSTAIILSIILGGLGVDRFYLGYTGLGIVKLLTLGGMLIWYVIDVVFLLTGQLTPREKSDSTEATKSSSGIATSGIFNGLFRLRKDKIIAGVCSGLAAKTRLNVWIFRLIVMFTGIGFIAYIVLAIKLPLLDESPVPAEGPNAIDEFVKGLAMVQKDKILCGVCTGLAAKYKANVWIFRIIALFTGIGTIIYICLAAKLPTVENPEDIANVENIPVVEDKAWAESGKKKMTALILSLLLGSFGVDRFYLGYIGLGIVKLLTCGGFGIWSIIDLVLLLTNKLTPNGTSPEGEAKSIFDGFYRMQEGKLIAGVCSGLADKFKLNVWIFRVIAILTGFGSIAYIVLVIAVDYKDAPTNVPATSSPSPSEQIPTGPVSIWDFYALKKKTALLLSIFTGGFGIDRFYLGYTGLGIAKMLTAGGLGIWSIIDIIFIATDKLQPRANGDQPVERTKTTAALLGFFLGFFGIMDFYAGRVKRGILKLVLSLTGIGSIVTVILNIIDLFQVSNGKYLMGNGRPFQGEPKTAKILAIVNAALYGVSVIATIATFFVIPLIASSIGFSSSKSAAYDIGNNAKQSNSPNAFVDPRDGTTYPLKEINDATWMTRPLSYKTSGSYCYGNDPDNCAIYGRLYTWNAATRSCPSGWHLPTSEDFQNLHGNLSIFQAHYPGFRNTKGKFELQGTRLDMWSDEKVGSKVLYWFISANNPYVLDVSEFSKAAAMTVFCVKNPVNYNPAVSSTENQYAWLSKRRLSANDLYSYSSSELRILRNAIYASHGYIFESRDLQEHFGQFSWYRPRTRNVSLTSIEKANVELIKSLE